MTSKTFFFSILIAFAVRLAAQHPVGVNLAAYSDFSPEFLFKDAFKSGREWITFNPGNINLWDNGLAVPMRPDGYPAQVPFQDTVAVRTLVLWNLPHGYPAGDFTLLSEGAGQIRVRLNGDWGSAMTFSSPANAVFHGDGTSGIILEILQSDPADPVHNIRFVLPGFAADFETQAFHPLLLDFLTDFECVRWMEPMRINGSPLSAWGDRTRTDFYSQAQPGGVAYEYLLALSNAAGKNVWVNIPHRADDDFVTQFATLLRDGLDPELKIYVEYSNEVWNSAFGQFNYALTQANALGYPGTNGEKVRRFYARRSAEVFAIFDSVFAGQNDRLVKVLGGQATNLFGTGRVLQAFHSPLYNPQGVDADAFAVAPYFGGGIGQQICDAGTAASITVPEILDMAEAALPAVFANMLSQRDSAVAYGLAFIAYEGGPHLENGAGSCDNNAALTQKLTDANRHERMGDLYCDYLSFWFEEAGGGLFMHYNSHSNYNQHGSWGLKEYLGQPEDSAPKYSAVRRIIAMELCSVGILEPGEAAQPPRFQLFPNPCTDFASVQSPGGDRLKSAEILDLQGAVRLRAGDFSTQLDLSALPPGVYFCRLQSEGHFFETHRLIKI